VDDASGDPQGQDAVPEDGALAEPAAGKPTSTRIRIVRIGFSVVVAVALALLLWRQREEVALALQSVSIAAVAGSLAAGIVGVALPAVVWRDLLVAQGFRVPLVGAARAFFLAQLGKYIPGGVWSLAAQVYLARELKVPGRPAAAATLLVLALSIVAAGVLAVVTVPVALPELAADYWWVFAVLPVLLVLLHPRMVEWWTGRGFRLIGRPAPPVRLTWPLVIRSSALLAGSWVALGAHFAFLAQGVPGADPSVWLLSIGVFALAWVAGFLFVIAPAGAGVREAALVLGFAAVLPAGTVVTLALLSRFLLIVADVALAGLATGAAGLRRSRSAAATDGR
jgi:uncharacterized membrane protein YbhN (UPF0104 family)